MLESGIITSKGEKRRIQTAISTHSSHIVSESQFTDIKYLRREENGNEVKAHNMSDLEKEYADDKDAYRFLKQYLTLTRSELFFADKAIFIEGDTERILIPAMMRKVDEEEKPDVELPLISQNISIIEVGAYSHKFAKFINFIGLKKCIVITDLDIAERCDKNGKTYCCSCEYDENKTLYTTNAAIKAYMNVDELSKIISLAQNKRLFAWDSDSKGWKQNEQGNMLLCYQQKDNGYQASSFEDAFINLNKDFFLDEQNAFEHGFKSTKLKGLKSQKSVYNFARNGVKSKSALAVEILLNSKENGDRHFSNWEIPSYIKEGLLWLRRD